MYGGGLSVNNNGAATFKGNSVIQFITNRADYGGAIISQNTTMVQFQEHTRTIFIDNISTDLGGVICNIMISNVFFTQFSTVLFYNSAKFGENIFTKDNSSVLITANSTVKFNNNTARWYGGIPYSNKYGYSDITIDSNGTVTCSDPETLPVCIHQTCFCQVIDNVLDNLISNTHINLSINVTLRIFNYCISGP